MTKPTPLDDAHAAMEADADDTTARLGFFERLADSELFMLLQNETIGETLSPEVLEHEAAQYVLVFDREERLAEFVGGSAHHASLSGRVIANMLAGQGVGLGLNLNVAPSSILIPADALDWLCEMLANSPEEVTERPVSIETPKELPENLLQALDAKLATATGLGHSAYLVGVVFEGGRKGHMLVFIDAVFGAQGALAKAVNEALSFCAVEAAELDVTFLAADNPICEKLGKVGLRFDMPQNKPAMHTPATPGKDPNSPPILR